MADEGVTEVTETEEGEPVVEAPAESEAQVVPRDVLPEELRDQPEEKVKLYLDAMRQGLTTRQAENDQLRAELAEARSGAVPAHAVPDLPETEDLSKEDLQQLILDDPEKALDYYAEKRFGPRLRAMETIGGEGVFAAAHQRWKDFGEVESDVRELVSQAGQAPNAILVENAYIWAQGKLRLRERDEALAKASRATKPSPPAAGDDKPSLSKLEKEIAAASDMTVEEMLQFKDQDEMTMEVPRG